jgi:hypothetical protein
MKPIGIVIHGLFSMSPYAALSDDREAAVRSPIQAFYMAFDDNSQTISAWFVSFPSRQTTSNLFTSL